MEIEFVYSGICNFINIKNDDESIIGPSVILIKADDQRLPLGHVHGGNGNGNGKPPEHEHSLPAPQPPASGAGVPERTPDNNHIPYLAFDTRLATVADDTGFNPVRHAPSFNFLKIDDMELQIDGHGVGVPIIDPTFHNIIGNDAFGLETRGRYNPDAVPARGDRPKKSLITSWMRFGSGKISGGRLCPFKWKITKVNGDVISRHFAEEAVYSFEETELPELCVSLVDLEDKSTVRRRLVFKPKPGNPKLTLFVGNNIESDMDSAVGRRRPAGAPSRAGHFAFFNNILSNGSAEVLQLPEIVTPPGPGGSGGGGGADGGICGPKDG